MGASQPTSMREWGGHGPWWEVGGGGWGGAIDTQEDRTVSFFAWFTVDGSVKMKLCSQFKLVRLGIRNTLCE